MTTLSRRLAEELLALKAVVLRPSEPFTWASGYRMPVYNDNRRLLAIPSLRTDIATAFKQILFEQGLDPTAIAGTATAGIPYATTLADLLQKPLCYIRSSNKDHGTGRRIEGYFEPESSFVVVEDLISTGGSSVSAVNALTESGGRVLGCVALFSYGFSEASQAFNRINCPLRVLLTFNELLDVAIEKQAIDSPGVKLLQSWSNSPFDWAARHGFTQ